jgi:DNA helicase-2/ATP-dependent DNA helicase PcrA
LGNIGAMIADAEAFAVDEPQADLARFLELVSLRSDADDRDESTDKATIMTLHAAKGLEFPVVFLIGVEHNILPHERSLREGGEEEERRLAFVGITRAKEELTLSYVGRRTYQGKSSSSAPSRFLQELDPAAIRREDCAPAAAVAGAHGRDDVNQETGYEEPSIPVIRDVGAPSPADRFHRGMWVQHPEYGRGVILDVDGNGHGRKATVQFTTVGELRFVLAKSNLVPLP